MRIILDVEKEIFEERLRQNFTRLRLPIMFDITYDSKSFMIFKKLDSGQYEYSFTRPFFFNPFKILTPNYKYIFSVEECNSGIVVNGRIKIKNFVIGAIILLGLWNGYDAFTYVFEKDLSFWLFNLGVPIFLIIFLAIEYRLFKMKVKKFINSLKA